MRWRRIFHTPDSEYEIPVSDSITCPTRANVHRSVGKPLARAPLSSASPTCWISLSDNWGRLPARPAADSAFLPSSHQAQYQFHAAVRDTPNAAATSAWDLPRRNMSAARIRRASSASKSRRARTAFLLALFPGATRDAGTYSVSHIDVTTSMY
jgi:hypothetical protein